MTLPFPSETYRDIVEDDARLRLQRLTGSLDGDEIGAGIVAFSHDISFEEQPWHALEHSTTYRINAYDKIDWTILRHPNPPHYLQVIVGALTTAMVDHHNVSPSSGGPIFRPHIEDLALHLDTIWAGFKDDTALLEEGDEAIIYQTPPFNYLRLMLSRQAGSLSLDFVHTQRFAKLRLTPPRSEQ
jgi:hypothetical protein